MSKEYKKATNISCLFLNNLKNYKKNNTIRLSKKKRGFMGTLYIVATPIGNIKDITARAVEILKNVDIILCEDTRTSSHLLNSLEIKNKLMSYHKFNEFERSEEVINYLKNGKDIAIITDAGTPCISDPGSILIKEAIDNKIEVYSIPGPSAIITALSLSGITIHNFAFYGFLERKKSVQKKQLKEIYQNDIELVVFYESPKRILETLENIQEVMNNPDVIVLNDLTKKFERKYYGKTQNVLEELNNNKNYELGEYVIIVHKTKQIKNDFEKLSPEALIIDKIIKEKCTTKDAIAILSKEQNDYSKNELYQASLNLKKIIK